MINMPDNNVISMLDEKLFINICKRYFSSLSRRSTQYAYINTSDDTILLNNSTSSGANIIHGDRLMNYSVGELSFHLLRPLSSQCKQWVSTLYKYLNIPDNEYVVLKLPALLSLFNKFKLNCMHAVWKQDFLYLKIDNSDELTTKNMVGHRLHNFHIIQQLKLWNKQIRILGSDEHQKKFIHHHEPCNIHIPMDGRIFFIPVKMSWYTNPDQTPVFPADKGYQQELRLLGIDGLSCVSLKEFAMKYPHSYSLTWYSWVVHQAIYSMTIFNSDDIEIKSIRPYTPLIPLQLVTSPNY